MYTKENALADLELVKRVLSAETATRNMFFDAFANEYIKHKEHLFKYFDQKGRLESVIVQGLNKKSDVVEFVSDVLKKKFSDHDAFVLQDYIRTTLEAFGQPVIAFLTNAIVTDVEHNGRFFQKGTKLTKALCKCIAENDSAKSFLQENLPQALSYVYDSITHNQRCCLSINPLDILFCSTHASFTSCHKLSGAYASGAVAYINDRNSLIAFTYEEKKQYENRGVCFDWEYKLWRQYVFIDTDNYSAVMQREYPKSSAAATKEARRLTASLLYNYAHDNGDEIQMNWKVAHSKYDDEERYGDDRVHLDFGGYGYGGDSQSSVIFMREKIFEGSYGNPYACPACGTFREDEVDRDDRGVAGFLCNECQGLVRCICPICGGEMNECDDVCERCRDDGYAVCEDCGEIQQIEIEGVCYDCAIARGYEGCDCCGELTLHAKHFKGRVLCEYCYGKYYSVCTVCGEVYRRSDMILYVSNGKDVFCCSDCSEKHNVECAACGKETNVQSTVIINGMTLCKKCADEYVYTTHNGYMHKSKLVRFDGEYFSKDEELYVFERRVGDQNFIAIIDNNFNRHYTHIVLCEFPEIANNLAPIARVKFTDHVPEQPLELLPEDARKKWYMRGTEVILFANYYLCAEEVL